MKFILVIYILLGTVMSAMITDTPTVKWGFKEALITAAVHIPFIAGGALLAITSKPMDGRYRHGLSPGGWGIALVVSYAVGFFGFMFAK